jgi:hypothetical protein
VPATNPAATSSTAEPRFRGGGAGGGGWGGAGRGVTPAGRPSGAAVARFAAGRVGAPPTRMAWEHFGQRTALPWESSGHSTTVRQPGQVMRMAM